MKNEVISTQVVIKIIIFAKNLNPEIAKKETLRAI